MVNVKAWVNTWQNTPEPFNLTQINIQELRGYLKKIKNGKSCGPDNIDGTTLIEEAILQFVNQSLSEQSFPSQLKQQIVHPQHKKGDRTRKEKQRPISHIPEVGKLVERVVAEQITLYMIENNLKSDVQHGAIKDHSPLTAMACMKGADEKNFTSILLIDLTAAYDLIDHDILDRKLKSYV